MENYSGYDPIILQGNMVGHPSIPDDYPASPSSFVSFNRETKVAKSISGREYFLNNFESTGFAKTEEEGLDWVEQNWVKK